MADPASGVMGSLSNINLASVGKVAAFVTLVPVIAFIVNMILLRQPPGHAGALFSWNSPILVKRHRFDECIHTEVDGWPAKQCNHPKKTARKYVRYNKYLRNWYRENLGEIKPKREIVKYQQCSLRRKERCECTHMMGKIIWESVSLKLPWRKEHSIPTQLRTTVLDPTTVDIQLKDGGVSQHRFEPVIDWYVSRDPRDDAPLRADHEYRVEDLTRSIIEEVAKAAKMAQYQSDILFLDKQKDVDNTWVIHNIVNDICKDKLMNDFGVVLKQFKLREGARTPQQVLADALKPKTSGPDNPPPSEDDDTTKNAIIVADQLGIS